MAIKLTSIGGTDWTDGTILYSVDLNDTFDAVIGAGNVIIPTLMKTHTTVAGTWTATRNTSALYNGSLNNTTTADGDEVRWPVTLQKGTYTLYVLGYTNTTAGIADYYIDGVEVGSLDWYGGSSTDVLKSVTGIVVDNPGTVFFNVKIDGKNASSTDYILDMQQIMLVRTSN